MTHALVLGGSGMLSETAIELTRSFESVSVVARNSGRLSELQKANHRIVPIAADYTSPDKLLAEIQKSVGAHGNISLVVCWVHDIAPKAPWLVAERLNMYHTPVQFYHVLGCSYSQPAEGAVELKKSFLDLSNIIYHQIILGFVLEQKSSRWLTNNEISSGVLRSIESGAADTIVGSVQPWTMRP